MSEKVLVIDGSTRKDGNTAALLRALVKGEACVTAGRLSGIAPCVNCGGCRGTNVCVYKDGMEPVYAAAETARFAVLASPVYFGNVTGFVLDVLSRFTRYMVDVYGRLPRVGPVKEGAVILTAGGYGNPETAEKTARMLMKFLHVENPVCITSYHTDTVPAERDAAALSAAADLRKRWFGS